MRSRTKGRCRAALRRLHRLEIRVSDIEQAIRSAEGIDQPAVAIGSPCILLEQALEAHGVDMNDPILTGLAALESDLWTLQRSVSAPPAGPPRIVEALDRLAQRATLLVQLTRRGENHA